MPDLTNLIGDLGGFAEAALRHLLEAAHSGGIAEPEHNDYGGRDADVDYGCALLSWERAEEARELLGRFGVNWRDPAVSIAFAEDVGGRVQRDDNGWWVGAFTSHEESFATEGDAAWAYLRSHFAGVLGFEPGDFAKAETIDEFPFDVALGEGWAFFEGGDGLWHLCRDDSPDIEGVEKLGSDLDAWVFVAGKARDGSAYHVRALELLGEDNPACRAAILQHTGY